ncbi:MAG TPA: 5'-methylthioadenosine/S-adenosylhomocysteine nucleosidase [Mycobacterium sp.]|nr:5'-methylthioadenosine/S-adenosylhomocysteine nucleosidase [Mycobacterium sp.]
MPGKACARRVGGLAVALGVAAAALTGWNSGIAWADESGDAAGATASSTPSDTDSATGNSSPAQEAAKSGDTETTTTNDDDVRTAPPGVVVGTGGLIEEPSTDPTPEPSETKPTTKKGSDPAEAKPTKKKTPPPESRVTDAKDDATPTGAAARDVATDTVTQRSDTTEPPGTASLRIASTQSLVATQTPQLTTEPTAKPMPPNLVTVVSRIVTGVVNAILSPFAAINTPGAPADTPSIWALLAFARREFEKAFTSPSLTDKPAEPNTTSQTEPEQRTLILTAFPAETDAILSRTTLDPNPTVVVDGHHYYLGTLGGKKVIVAMTGIGMVNATRTTETALDHFTPESGISIDAVVFSGVAGGSGRTEIGDVAVPARWTSDDGETWHAVDAGMLATANTLDVDLLSSDTLGDPACYCGLLAGPRIDLGREPDLHVGGDGSSDDNNNGTAFPAIPLGGDVFGPQPCRAPDYSLLSTGNFFQAVVPFLAFGLLSNITGFLTDTPPAVDAVDQETAAAQQVADAHGIPFLGIRGMSDGPGDPLNLPGYPFSFLVYKQIAADNAAIVTEAFLQNWDDT